MTVTDTLAREIEGAVLEAASMLADERAVREVPCGYSTPWTAR